MHASLWQSLFISLHLAFGTKALKYIHACVFFKGKRKNLYAKSGIFLKIKHFCSEPPQSLLHQFSTTEENHPLKYILLRSIAFFVILRKIILQLIMSCERGKENHKSFWQSRIFVPYIWVGLYLLNFDIWIQNIQQYSQLSHQSVLLLLT